MFKGEFSIDFVMQFVNFLGTKIYQAFQWAAHRKGSKTRRQ